MFPFAGHLGRLATPAHYTSEKRHSGALQTT